MSGYIRDRWVWLGLGITLSGLCILQAWLYSKHNELSSVPEAEDEPQTETQTPTSLSLRTLRTLVDSPNSNISQMAVDLIRARMHDREMKAKVYSLIRADANSSDITVRQKALTTLRYLRDEPDLPSVNSPTLSAASTTSPHLDGDSWTVNFDQTFIPSQQSPIAGWTAIPRERPQAGDEAVRRRRREAVVLHEGAGEVNEDDIIRPADFL